MCMHEEKICPRCSNKFECKLGSITECQCYGIVLTTEESAFIENRYNDCLCRKCLLELKNRYMIFKEKFLFK
ncbi:MAG: hypothetical protein E6H06_15070 [Bacteroidetes bacterium]|nr:MAG: hypothetical protein E6H06_15070 [Bacteroidota bacterium]